MSHPMGPLVIISVITVIPLYSLVGDTAGDIRNNWTVTNGKEKDL